MIIDEPVVAHSVRALIEADMAPGSSWRTGVDHPDSVVPLGKRIKLRVLQWLPLESLL